MPRVGKRAIRLVLVFGLSFGIPVQSSRAMLPEILVGGTVLVQVAQVLTDLLPQLATLGTSLVGLANASKEAGGTLNRIFLQLFPQKPSAAKSKPRKETGPISVPTISGPTDAAPAPTADAEVPPADAAVSGDLDSKLSQLVTSYRQRLEPSSAAFGGASATRASFTRAETSYETLSDQTAEALIETVRGGDKKSLEHFVASVRKLSPEDLPAVSPVLEAALIKGARFARVHGDTLSVAGFQKLKGLHDSVK